ncbi:MAG: hypothetical protein AAFU71_09505 [Cyanobacteria bacterium J06632_22]
MSHYQALLDELQVQAAAIRESGSVAPVGIWIEVYTPGGRKVAYARLKGKNGIPGDATKKSQGIGKVDGNAHRDCCDRDNRRNSLQEIERRVALLLQWQSDQIWQPDAGTSGEKH